MENPISPRVRGHLYVASIVVGSLAVIVGPLIVALAIPNVWAAVITSAIGAVTSLIGLLARENLPAPEQVDIEEEY